MFPPARTQPSIAFMLSPVDWIQKIPEHRRTRFAPAPTGFLHLGHVVNAIFVWGIARARNGTVLGRLEDHDADRCRPEFEAAIREDLGWLGLEPDQAWQRQSDDLDRYARTLAELAHSSPIYACDCSRKSLLARRSAASASTTEGEEIPYDGFCRQRDLEPGADRSLRLHWPNDSESDSGSNSDSDSDSAIEQEIRESFEDIRLGPQTQNIAGQCGDMLLKDRKGNWTYQFAVTVDDLDQEIDLIIRGRDILPSTGRQLRLGRLLGRSDAPLFVHHDLILGADGRKLSKRDRSRGVRELRRRGRSPEQVLGLAAWAAGLQARPTPVSAEEIKYLF